MSLLDYLATVSPSSETWHLATATIAGVLLLFFLAELVARLTIVYKRNNLSILFALALVVIGFYAFGYVGVLAFVAGTLSGAWLWVREVAAANARARVHIEETKGAPASTFARRYQHPDTNHVVSGT